MPPYSALVLIAVGAVVAAELGHFRTGIFRRSSYWLTMAIMWLFQIPVDGWLTKLSSPIVRYDPDHFSGIRIFFDSPIEDFGFAFALVTLPIVLWQRQNRAVVPAADATTEADHDAARFQEVGDG